VWDHLKFFIEANRHSIQLGNKLSNDIFWSARKQQMNQVLNWLRSAETVQYLENLFFANYDASDTDALALAIDSLNWLRMLQPVVI
jgi:hypothetical protein